MHGFFVARRILFGIVVIASLASCTGTAEGSATPAARSGSISLAAAAPAGRIVFDRWSGGGTPTGRRMHLLANPDGSHVVPLLARHPDVEVGQPSPDGSLLSIVAPNAQGLVVGGTVKMDGSHYRLFANPDPTLNLACTVWSPNGRRLACEAWDDTKPARSGIYTVRASDGGDLRRLTHERDMPCDYSPDGSRLAYIRISNDDQTNELWVIEPALPRSIPTGLRHHVTGGCDWSPDGRRILTESEGALVLVMADGTTGRFVLDGPGGYATTPHWSPDGSHIVFAMTVRDADPQFDIYTAAVDGSGVTRITTSPLYEEAMAWSP